MGERAVAGARSPRVHCSPGSSDLYGRRRLARTRNRPALALRRPQRSGHDGGQHTGGARTGSRRPLDRAPFSPDSSGGRRAAATATWPVRTRPSGWQPDGHRHHHLVESERRHHSARRAQVSSSWARSAELASGRGGRHLEPARAARGRASQSLRADSCRAGSSPRPSAWPPLGPRRKPLEVLRRAIRPRDANEPNDARPERTATSTQPAIRRTSLLFARTLAHPRPGQHQGRR
jgi:hypothetical protein